MPATTELHFSDRELREYADIRLLNSTFGAVRVVDEEFDDMMQFGLHDEHAIRSIMDLPAPVGEMFNHG
jgi:hypothetical protein